MKRSLPTYTAPEELLEEAAEVSAINAEERGEVDFPDSHKSHRIADREDEYRKQWRKRACLSPPKADPYAKLQRKGWTDSTKKKSSSKSDTGTKAEPPKERTYRDVMAEHEVEVEKALVERELVKKKKEEEEALKKAREERDALKRKKEEEDDDTPDSRWLISIVKGGSTLEQIDLWSALEKSRDGTIKFGADESGCDVLLLHPSCNSHHAKLRMPNKDNCDGSTPDACPRIVDLASDNGTFVDGKRLVPGQYRALQDGNIITFAYSTRQYIVMRR